MAMESKERELRVLETKEGRIPFVEWLGQLRDKVAIRRIEARLYRASVGNFGDWKAIGEGVCEMRVDFGPGYRVYYALHEDAIIVLLVGGDKSSQSQDIELALQIWKENKDAPKRFRRHD